MSRGMREYGVAVVGLNETVRALRRVEKDAPKEVTKANKKAAETAVPYVQRTTPVLTGTLRRSVKARATQRSASVVAGKAGRSKLYAGVIHWGWPRRNIKRNEFMTRGAEKARPQVLKVYEDALGGVLRKFSQE